MNREDKAREFTEEGNQIKDVMLKSLTTQQEFEIVDFRFNLIYDEVLELSDAIDRASLDIDEYGFISNPTLENILKELADIQYVLSGFAAVFNLPLDEAYNRVHESNMSKFPASYREDGKVLKGENYKEPFLKDLI